MGNEIKETAEWKALNEIWKKLRKQERIELELEFRLLSEFIRNNQWKLKSELRPANPHDKFGYISLMPEDAKLFVIDLVNQGEPNLYHSFMAIFDGERFRDRPLDREEILSYYLARYGGKRPYLIENPNYVEAVLDFCLIRKLAKRKRRQNK